MSIEHAPSTNATSRVERTPPGRGHPQAAAKGGAAPAAPGGFEQLLSMLGAAMGDAAADTAADAGAGTLADGGGALPAAVPQDPAAGAAAKPQPADGLPLPDASGVDAAAQAAVLAQCLPATPRAADGGRSLPSMAGTGAVGALAAGADPAASAAIGRGTDGRRQAVGADAPAVPGAAGDDPAAALATGGAARSAADGVLPSAHAKPAAARHTDAQALHKPEAREPALAEAAPPAAPQSATVDLAVAVGPRPLREGERREPDGSPVGALHGHDGAAQATGGALTSYALTEPEPAAATTEVAEQLRYWISAGVQNAELQVDAFGGGTVEVSVTVQGNEARVEFRSDQPEARRLLQDAMPQLRSMLQDEGMVLSGGFVGTSAQGGGDPQGRRRTDRPTTQATVPVAVAERPSAAAGARRGSATGSRLDVFV